MLEVKAFKPCPSHEGQGFFNQSKEIIMSTLKIDNVDYDTETLSEVANSNSRC